MIQGLDPHSPTWHAIEAWAKAEIEQARDRLEGKDSPEDRGEIKALRRLIDLPRAPQAPRIIPRAPLIADGLTEAN